jgi:hypothetical protein
VSTASMNPSIPTDYLETGAWLMGFVRSHAKREDVRIEVLLDMAGPREGCSYGLRLTLGPRVSPPLGSPPIELDFQEVAEGRTHFAWCASLGERVQGAARQLHGAVRSAV